MKRGREYHGSGEEYNVEIRKEISSSRKCQGCLGRISSGDSGMGTEIFGKNIKLKQIEAGKSIKL